MISMMYLHYYILANISLNHKEKSLNYSQWLQCHNVSMFHFLIDSSLLEKYYCIYWGKIGKINFMLDSMFGNAYFITLLPIFLVFNYNDSYLSI